VRKTRIAVVGAGTIGRAHIDALRASRTCELAAVVDPAPAAKAPYRSLGELLAADRPDGVVLATPNRLHLPQALECLAAGVPVLIEKPVTATLAEGEQLLREARHGRVLVGHHRAHSPIMAEARRVIENGKLGRLVSVVGSALFYKPDTYFDEAPWRREPGGGPILINLIHEIHNLRMLCGEIAAVQAFTSNVVRGFPVEDTAAISLRFASGALGTFLLSDTAASARSWEQTARENPIYASYDDQDCYVISGTKGSLSVPTMRLDTFAGEPSWWTPFQRKRIDLDRADPIARQMEHFGAVARGEAEPLVSVRDGVANVRVTEAIVEAAKTGRTLRVQ
jgi:predicted dehydrogenase